MNIYVVVEGVAELQIYPYWITFVNPTLSWIHDLSTVDENNFYVFSARGYPQIFNVIENAIEDMMLYPKFNRLVIALDSEDLSRDERILEVNNFLKTKKHPADTRIIIQHFCIETWALGNRIITKRQPNSPRLQSYRRLFDVTTSDPELLPAKPDEELNRAQFAEQYLRLTLNDRNPQLSYSKSRPYQLTKMHYFEQVKKRFEKTKHIKSFEDFLKAFV